MTMASREGVREGAAAAMSGAAEAPLAARAVGLKAYSPGVLPRGAKVELALDANEGPRALWAGGGALVEEEALRRYPSAAALEAKIAAKWGIDAALVVATAGGDDAIDRVCRAVIGPGDELVFPVPSFEMIERFAVLAGGVSRRVEWGRGEFPVREVIDAATERTRLVSLVTPNNPTGGVISLQAIRDVSRALPGTWLMVDLAYGEFADEDPMREVLALPNVVVIRTFSKAFAMAGARVGYAAGPERLINALRAVGEPFAVSGPSAAVAAARLEKFEEVVKPSVARVRSEREAIARVLVDVGARPFASQANFVLGEFASEARAAWVWRALLSLGVLVRAYGPGYPQPLPRCLRITCPGDDAACERLLAGLRAAARPEAILLDMDGVLADVGGSYREAIRVTCEAFGVRVTPADVQAEKDKGDANNDWIVTRRLLAGRGVDASLDEVTRRFEGAYWGENGRPGLVERETLIPARGVLEALKGRARLGIVTGRPRKDAELFLRRFGLAELFETAVCMEDATRKPDPAPVRLAMERLGVRAAWMVGDTPDDLVAARGAGAVPIGVPVPGGNDAAQGTTLEGAGAARVVRGLEELLEMLP